MSWRKYPELMMSIALERGLLLYKRSSCIAGSIITLQANGTCTRKPNRSLWSMTPADSNGCRIFDWPSRGQRAIYRMHLRSIFRRGWRTRQYLDGHMHRANNLDYALGYISLHLALVPLLVASTEPARQRTLHYASLAPPLKGRDDAGCKTQLPSVPDPRGEEEGWTQARHQHTPNPCMHMRT